MIYARGIFFDTFYFIISVIITFKVCVRIGKRYFPDWGLIKRVSSLDPQDWHLYPRGDHQLFFTAFLRAENCEASPQSICIIRALISIKSGDDIRHSLLLMKQRTYTSLNQMLHTLKSQTFIKSPSNIE